MTGHTRTDHPGGEDLSMRIEELHAENRRLRRLIESQREAWKLQVTRARSTQSEADGT